MPVYGTFDDVADAVEAARADTVIVLSCPELDGHMLRRLGWRLEREDIDLIVANSLIDVAGARTTVRPVDGLPMLHVEHARLSGVARAFKSVFDWVGAGLGLLAAVAAAAGGRDRGEVRLARSGPVPADPGRQGRPRVPDLQVPDHVHRRRAPAGRARGT